VDCKQIMVFRFIHLHALIKLGITFLIAVILFPGGLLFSQMPGDTLFDISVLHEIRINFNEPDYWNILLENYNGNVIKSHEQNFDPQKDPRSMYEQLNNLVKAAEDDVPYLEASITVDGTAIDPVGVRLKGYSSFFYANEFKKSFKIDFNEYNDTLNYFGINKINLNNGVGDPSFQRDVICYDLLKKAGIAVPRTAYAKLYLNDVYWGLYLLVEQVDKSFLKEHFASDEGNLYKAVGWTNLEYISDRFADYSESIRLRTNEDISDGSDYVNLVKSINFLNGEDFNDSIQKLFYVDYFLKILAVDVITKNWDSYMQHGRNLYLYHEPVSDLFYWIPWDYNLSLDGQFNSTWSEDDSNCRAKIDFSYDTIGTSMKYAVSIANSKFDYLWINFGDSRDTTLQGQDFQEDSLILDTFTAVHHYRKRGIYPVEYFVGDTNQCYYSSDTNIILMDTTGLCPMVLYLHQAYHQGDTSFNKVFEADSFCCTCQWDNLCENLKSKIESQWYYDDSMYPIIYNMDKPLITKIMANPEFMDRYLDIFNYILDSVYHEDEIRQQIIANSNLIRDAVYADTNFIFTAVEFENDISAICQHKFLINSLSRLIPGRKEGLREEFSSLGYTPKPVLRQVNYNDVVINEIAAALHNDDDESLPDWIELYNNTGDIIPLDHFWLSDSMPEPEKYNFRGITAIKPNGFIIVWADKKEKKDGLHTDFKLDADGEELILYNDLYGTIDTLQFGQQYNDITYGRYPDGTGVLAYMPPSMNLPNRTFVDLEYPEGSEFTDGVIVYPNPASAKLFIMSDIDGGFRFTLYTMQGRELLHEISQEPIKELSVSEIPKGIYVFKVETPNACFSTKIIID
jgi:hypothetical protein